jgi:hypothetical protein
MVHAEIEFREIAMQMLGGHMLVRSNEATLEDAEIASAELVWTRSPASVVRANALSWSTLSWFGIMYL